MRTIMHYICERRGRVVFSILSPSNHAKMMNEHFGALFSNLWTRLVVSKTPL